MPPSFANDWPLTACTEDDVCLASSDVGCSKYDGGLVDVLVGELGVPPGKVFHRGDDLRGDVEVPRRRGIKTGHVTRCRMNRFESILEQHRWDTEGLSSVMAGASRLARLGTPTTSEGERSIREVAAVAGPVLVAYVLWLLRTAANAGLQRLYFVSRDGEVLLHLARSLQPAFGTDLELRYLYGSRQAWHLPALACRGDSDRSWVLEDAEALSPRQFLHRFGLHPERFAETLTAVGLPERGWDRSLGVDGVRAAARLIDDPEVRRASQEQAAVQAGLMEMFGAGSHGPVLGYAEGAEVGPMLGQSQNLPALRWGLDRYRNTLDRFVAELILDPELVNPAADLRLVVADLARAFWTSPTPTEAAAWGSFPFEHDQQGLWSTPVAAPLGFADLRAKLHRPPDEQAWGLWRDGSIARSSPWLRTLAAGARRARRVASAVRLRTGLPQHGGRR